MRGVFSLKLKFDEGRFIEGPQFGKKTYSISGNCDVSVGRDELKHVPHQQRVTNAIFT